MLGYTALPGITLSESKLPYRNGKIIMKELKEYSLENTDLFKYVKTNDLFSAMMEHTEGHEHVLMRLNSEQFIEIVERMFKESVSWVTRALVNAGLADYKLKGYPRALSKHLTTLFHPGDRTRFEFMLSALGREINQHCNQEHVKDFIKVVCNHSISNMVSVLEHIPHSCQPAMETALEMMFKSNSRLQTRTRTDFAGILHVLKTHAEFLDMGRFDAKHLALLLDICLHPGIDIGKIQWAPMDSAVQGGAWSAVEGALTGSLSPQSVLTAAFSSYAQDYFWNALTHSVPPGGAEDVKAVLTKHPCVYEVLQRMIDLKPLKLQPEDSITKQICDNIDKIDPDKIDPSANAKAICQMCIMCSDQGTSKTDFETYATHLKKHGKDVINEYARHVFDQKDQSKSSIGGSTRSFIAEHIANLSDVIEKQTWFCEELIALHRKGRWKDGINILKEVEERLGDKTPGIVKDFNRGKTIQQADNSRLVNWTNITHAAQNRADFEVFKTKWKALDDKSKQYNDNKNYDEVLVAECIVAGNNRNDLPLTAQRMYDNLISMKLDEMKTDAFKNAMVIQNQKKNDNAKRALVRLPVDIRQTT